MALNSGMNLKDLLKVLKNLGANVKNIPRTGEIRISHPKMTKSIRTSHPRRRKDAPRSVVVFAKKLKKLLAGGSKKKEKKK